MSLFDAHRQVTQRTCIAKRDLALLTGARAPRAAELQERPASQQAASPPVTGLRSVQQQAALRQATGPRERQVEQQASPQAPELRVRPGE